ncbi:MAG: hypothetical protein KAH17_01070 [Bacteroidales bacterium]|nr:hypothetical protein [Bacteroidales bacterium]
MPYRRLPTTDAARLRALKTASVKADQLELGQLAFTTRYIHPIRNFQQQLETIKFQQTQSWKQIVSQNIDFKHNTDKTRMYITHFIQVLNMSIAREEMTQESRKFYNIAPDDKKLPRMLTDDALLEWGKHIIDGEGKRIRTGGAPIMNPTIAKVKVWYDRFKDMHHSQQIANKSYQRASSQLIDIRRKTDALIQAIWNEIEEHYQHLRDTERRAQCEEYGIVYVFRKNERKPN